MSYKTIPPSPFFSNLASSLPLPLPLPLPFPLPLLRERPRTTSATQPSLLLTHVAYMDPTSPHVEPTSNFGKAKKKSGGVMKIFKVALFMLRRRSNKSKETADTSSDKSVWRRLVGSMRPLHVQGNESPPTMSLAPLKPNKDLEELPMTLSLSPPSPSSSFSRTSRSSSFGTSKYASAINLQELDGRNDDDDDKNVIEDNNGGDEMIDAKAEEFIAQFYEQMRRQHRND